MREICTSGSEGGVAQTNAPFLPPIKALPFGRPFGISRLLVCEKQEKCFATKS